MPIDIWHYESRNTWCADVLTEKGRKRLYLGPDERKARAQLHRYMAEYYDSLDPDAGDSRPALRTASSGILLLDLAVRFLKWTKANRAGGTWRGYRDGLKHITRPHKTTLASELSLRDVELVKTDMIQKRYAARTINIMITAIKRLYSWGLKQGFVSEHRVANLERVSKHVNAPDHPEPKHLPFDRALGCIAICRHSPPLGEMCEVMLLTGMRVGEVVRVTWGDVDFGRNMLDLERHKTSGHTNRPRTIPLCKRALDILRKHATDDLEADQPVFRGQDDQAFTVSALHLRLRRLRRKQPELSGFSFHKLRHTCATYLARLEVPERVAQAILGHGSTLMTRYYTATDSDEMIDALE